MMGQEPVRRKPVDPNSQIYSQQHSRTRTTSSNVFPIHPQYHSQHQYQQQQQQQQHAPTMHLQQPQPSHGHTRRSPSVNTFSTVSSNPPPAAFRTSPSIDLRRSTSSRSGGGSTSYVALMRKQKATVWSDRAQTEDPRILAQQKAAKERANREVVGRGPTGRTSTGLSSGPGKVVGKIRHGKPGVTGYMAPQNYLGVNSVPLRLSATEVEGEDSDEDDVSMRKLHHRRTGSSGRSSTASAGRRAAAYRTSTGGYSMTNAGARKWSPGDTPERAGSLADEAGHAKEPGATTGTMRTTSTLSGSSAEKADALPELAKTSQAAKMASNSLLNAALHREKSVKNPEELRRRGSVDERTATLTKGRLFIANPD